VTRRAAGAGAAWYVATLPEHGALRRLCERILGDAGVERADHEGLGEQVELIRRGALLFAINHGPGSTELQVDGTDLLSGQPARGLVLPSQGVAIIEA
jgi:beta-galactosidase